MKRILLALCVLLVASLSTAQPAPTTEYPAANVTIAGEATNLEAWIASGAFSEVPSTTVSGLGSGDCPANPGQTCRVTDSTDCLASTPANVSYCRFEPGGWEVWGAGGGSFSPDADPSVDHSGFDAGVSANADVTAAKAHADAPGHTVDTGPIPDSCTGTQAQHGAAGGCVENATQPELDAHAALLTHQERAVVNDEAELEACLASPAPGKACVMNPVASWSDDITIDWIVASPASGHGFASTLDCSGLSFRRTVAGDWLNMVYGTGHDKVHAIRNCNFSTSVASGTGVEAISIDNSAADFDNHMFISNFYCGVNGGPEYCLRNSGSSIRTTHYDVINSHFQSTNVAFDDTQNNVLVAFSSVRANFVNTRIFGEGITAQGLRLRNRNIRIINSDIMGVTGGNYFAGAIVYIQNSKVENCGGGNPTPNHCFNFDTVGGSSYNSLFVRGMTLIGAQTATVAPFRFFGGGQFNMIDIEASNMTATRGGTTSCAIDAYYSSLTAPNHMLHADPDGTAVDRAKVKWSPRWDTFPLAPPDKYCTFRGGIATADFLAALPAANPLELDKTAVSVNGGSELREVDLEDTGDIAVSEASGVVTFDLVTPHTTNTDAESKCSGVGVLLDGEGNCTAPAGVLSESGGFMFPATSTTGLAVGTQASPTAKDVVIEPGEPIQSAHGYEGPVSLPTWKTISWGTNDTFSNAAGGDSFCLTILNNEARDVGNPDTAGGAAESLVMLNPNNDLVFGNYAIIVRSNLANWDAGDSLVGSLWGCPTPVSGDVPTDCTRLHTPALFTIDDANDTAGTEWNGDLSAVGTIAADTYKTFGICFDDSERISPDLDETIILHGMIEYRN